MSPSRHAHSATSLDLPNRRFWIFDMDGTLTLAQHDFAGMKRSLGLPMDQGILESLDAMPQAQRVIVEKAVDDWEYDLAAEAQPSKGALDLLRTLQERQTRLGILTRNSKRNALKTLEAAGLREFFAFEDILGRDNAPPKPDPSGIQQLLSRWQGEPNQAVMIGDFHFDLAAGRAAGCATIHLDTSGTYPWPELTDMGVVELIELRDLILVLERDVAY